MKGLPEIGDVLDDTYEIEALLGQGGFGAVYLARQISMDRQVAIKVLVAHAMRVDEMIERFRREVLAVRDLSHPNTIRIYDFRDREDGLLYYVMEYIKGPTLKDVIKEGPMPADRVIRILKQILESLSEAHAQNIVHRDLKPANIMLADLHGETDFVKVVDFGIAKIVNESEDEEEADPLTSAGVLVGTLRYMAPEQITGQGIGPQSDLYAAALMGVEMLTGESVFAGTGRWEVLHKQISDEPVEIAEEVLNSELGPVFRKALQKEPENRFQSAEDMVEALAEVDGTSSTVSGILARPSQFQKPESPSDEAPQNEEVSEDSGRHALEVGGGADDDQQTMMAPLPELNPPKDKAEQASGSSASGSIPPVGQFTPSPYSAHQDDDMTGSSSPGSSRSKLPLVMIGVAVTLLIVFIAVYMMRQDGMDETPDALAATEPQPGQRDVEKPKVDPQPADKADKPDVETRFVRIETPGIAVRVFEGSTLVGETPIRLMVAGTKTYRLEAEGHDEKTVEFTPDGPTEMTVEFEDDTQVDIDKKGEEKATEPRKTEGDDERKTGPKPARDKTSDTKKPEKKPASDWVEIEPAKKPEEKKKPEKKKPDVPLF